MLFGPVLFLTNSEISKAFKKNRDLEISRKNREKNSRKIREFRENREFQENREFLENRNFSKKIEKSKFREKIKNKARKKRFRKNRKKIEISGQNQTEKRTIKRELSGIRVGFSLK